MTPSAPPPGARAARPTPGTATARLCASGFVVSQRENNGPGHVTVLRASVRRGWQAVFPKAVASVGNEKTFGLPRSLLHAARSGGGGAANHTQPLQRAHRAWLRPFLSVPTASPVAQPQRPPGRPGADSVAWHQAGEEKTQACGRPWRACANLRTRWDRCVCVCVLA